MLLPTIIVTECLDSDQIEGFASAGTKHVIDVRTCLRGKARPIEERLLKKIYNWQLSYVQHPIVRSTPTSSDISSLLARLDLTNDGQLIVTDEITPLVSSMNKAKIVFVVHDQKSHAQPTDGISTQLAEAL